MAIQRKPRLDVPGLGGPARRREQRATFDLGWEGVHFSPMGSHPDEDVFSDTLSPPSRERAQLAQGLLPSLDEGEDAGAAEVRVAG
jgi:hypothetical protein